MSDWHILPSVGNILILRLKVKVFITLIGMSYESKKKCSSFYLAVNSSKKRTNVFVCTTMRRVFVRFLEEIEDTKQPFEIT